MSASAVLRPPGESTVVVAHRGGLPGPENTLPAFEQALLTRAAFVETDVRLTRDQVPVLIHDATLDRTTDGHGPVAEHTFSELRTLDAGAWHDPRYAGSRIPTLDELLALLAPTDMNALLELKGTWSIEQASLLVDLVHHHGLTDQVVLQSFDAATLHALAQCAPHLPRFLLAEELDGDPVEAVRASGCVGFGTTPELLAAHPQALAALHEADFVVFCFTVNSREVADLLRAAGVDGIITDTPALIGG
ncbi:glycerophosphodiester phosphodiesterase [Cryobacterium tepidiphilum]|nr:glycerophosphodiester phosphodiesterase family protein [Cryobacterium tepidiphilum]